MWKSQYRLAVPQNLAVRGLSTRNGIFVFYMSILKELKVDLVSNPFWRKFKVRKTHHLHSLFHINYTLWMTCKLPLRQWHRIIKGTKRSSELSEFRPGSVFKNLSSLFSRNHEDLNFWPKISIGKSTSSFVVSLLSWRTGGWNPARLYLLVGRGNIKPTPQHLEEGSGAVWDPKISLLIIPVCKTSSHFLFPLYQSYKS